MLQSVGQCVCVGTWGILCGAFGYDEARSHENLLIKIFQTSIHSTIHTECVSVDLTFGCCYIEKLLCVSVLYMLDGGAHTQNKCDTTRLE